MGVTGKLLCKSPDVMVRVMGKSKMLAENWALLNMKYMQSMYKMSVLMLASNAVLKKNVK